MIAAPRRLTLWLVGPMLALAACGGDAVSDEPVPATQSATTQPENTEPENTEPCPAAATVDPGPSSVDVDVDGDGLDDQVGIAQGNGLWHLTVGFGSGGDAAVSLVDADPSAAPIVGGAVDLAGDGRQHVVIVLGGGAYTRQLGFVGADGCDLQRLAFADGTPASFLTGASVVNFAAVRCGVGVVEQYEFTLVDGAADAAGGQSYQGAVSPYQLTGEVLAAAEPGRTTLSEVDLAAIPLLDCGDVA